MADPLLTAVQCIMLSRKRLAGVDQPSKHETPQLSALLLCGTSQCSNTVAFLNLPHYSLNAPYLARVQGVPDSVQSFSRRYFCQVERWADTQRFWPIPLCRGILRPRGLIASGCTLRSAGKTGHGTLKLENRLRLGVLAVGGLTVPIIMQIKAKLGCQPDLCQLLITSRTSCRHGDSLKFAPSVRYRQCSNLGASLSSACTLVEARQQLICPSGVV